jgi:hypothetical protein
MESFYLPNEILSIIFSFINDTNSYLSSRLVCRNWYDHLKIGKIFCRNKISETVYFLDNYIKFLDKNEKLVADVIFKNYGHYIYKTYGYYTQTITSSPFTLKKNANSFNSIDKIEYNILKDKKSSYRHQLPGCITM